jgi:hypothetical protein
MSSRVQALKPFSMETQILPRHKNHLHNAGHILTLGKPTGPNFPDDYSNGAIGLSKIFRALSHSYKIANF